MIKNKVDFKLVNLALIAFIVYILYQTGNVWTSVVEKILSIATPFFFAFVIAYALHPILRFLMDHKIKKGAAIAIVMLGFLGIIALAIGFSLPLLFDQLSSLFNGIISFVKELSVDLDISFGGFQEALTKTFNDIIGNLGSYVSDGAISVISISLNYLSLAMITLSASVYFLIDMDRIRFATRRYLERKSRKSFLYVRRLDIEMKQYLSGFLKIMFISLFEYAIIYKIIGHPNAFLLGLLGAIAGVIPYFGGIFVNMIAAITAFVIGFPLFIRTVITFVILSWIDGYVINPLVYGKTNRVHPLILILSVFAGGILLGVFGIIISLPVAILILSTYNYFKMDISEKIEDMREIKKKNKE